MSLSAFIAMSPGAEVGRSSHAAATIEEVKVSYTIGKVVWWGHTAKE